MLSRSEPGQHDTDSEKAQQQQNNRAKLARIHRFYRQPQSTNQRAQRNPHPTGVSGAKFIVQSPALILVHRGGFEPP